MPQYIKGHLGTDVSVTINEGELSANAGQGIWARSVGGAAALSNDNKQTMLMDFESTSGGAPIDLEWEATPTIGIVNIGAEYVGKDNTFFTLGYQGMFGDGVTQHAITARVGMRF